MRWRASLRLFDVSGVPVYAHVSLLPGLFVIGGFAFRPWAWLGLAIVVLVHEFGHVALIRHYRLPVLRVVLHGFGGECESVDWMSPWQTAVVAWGGVLAQALLLGLTVALANVGVLPLAVTSGDLFFALTVANAVMMVLNLLPFGVLDGRQAWRIVPLFYLRLKRTWLENRLKHVRAERATFDETESKDTESADDRRYLH